MAYLAYGSPFTYLPNLRYQGFKVSGTDLILNSFFSSFAILFSSIKAPHPNISFSALMNSFGLSGNSSLFIPYVFSMCHNITYLASSPMEPRPESMLFKNFFEFHQATSRSFMKLIIQSATELTEKSKPPA